MILDIYPNYCIHMPIPTPAPIQHVCFTGTAYVNNICEYDYSHLKTVMLNLESLFYTVYSSTIDTG